MPEILFFPFFGPGRRSDLRVVEIRLDFGADDTGLSSQQLAGVRQLLLETGVIKAGENYPEKPLAEHRFVRYSELLAQTAVLLQNKNGHRVKFFSVTHEQNRDRCTALVEHEHSEVGMAAVKLAIEVVAGKIQSFAGDYAVFAGFARERLLPIETEVIIKLARRRNIPVFQLEREPLKGHFDSSLRVRPNGLLILGYGSNCHVVDGTFCVDRAGDYLKALLRNPDQRRLVLENLKINTVKHERTSAGADSHLFHLLNINGRVTALEQLTGGELQLVEHVHESLIEMCRAINTEVACAAIAVSLRAASLSLPLSQTGAAVLDFSPAPDLGQLLAALKDGPDLMEVAAGDLLDWLFSGSESASMPVIAVTGTNGKTTTSRMLSHILQKSGHRPGLVCTDGIFLNGRQLTQTDASTFIGHARVLTSTQVDAAVLETHHRGIAIRGFAFQQCAVAVCLNVTEEHLEPGEIETLEEMAVIKRALLERASDTAVLFADDERCLGMVGFLSANRICLVSLRSGVARLREFVPPEQACFCVLETVENEAWIVLYKQWVRLPVMPVNHIPATFDGTARFNVSNAMHAIAAAYFSGLDIDSIRSALGVFSAGELFTPGRMNEFKGLPFRVFIDFAHNPDGMRNICDFVDRTKVKGRKLIAFAVAINRTEVASAKLVHEVAGHFDFYFCKDYAPREGGNIACLAPFIQQTLIAEGVPEEQTAVVTFGREVIYDILDSCEPGDLLMLVLGYVEKLTVPAYIRDYASRGRIRIASTNNSSAHEA